jgi:hypothetical protein
LILGKAKIKISRKSVLTIILAIKDVDERQLYRCISSILSLKYSEYIDLLIISSGVLPNLNNTPVHYLNDFTVISTEARGVYSAYNRGIDEKPNGYVLFLGVDDVVLPGLDRVIEFILSLEVQPELIAACSLMQDIGLSQPNKFKSYLIFANWCQQGLLYHSKLFEDKRFDTEYVVRADHKFNIELIGDKKNRVVYLSDVITHFSSGGFSSRVEDSKFKADMPAIIKQSYGNFYWLIALAASKLSKFVKFRFYKRRIQMPIHEIRH